MVASWRKAWTTFAHVYHNFLSLHFFSSSPPQAHIIVFTSNAPGDSIPPGSRCVARGSPSRRERCFQKLDLFFFPLLFEGADSIDQRYDQAVSKFDPSDT